MSTSFAEILREKRRLSGISQRRLADSVGVDFSYISKLENGRVPPPAADTIARIAKCIGCASEELLAAAEKLPDGVGSILSGNPAAVRFLQEASSLSLNETEWESMRGKLKRLRDTDKPGRPKRT
jgi:transcriptional regulator with XRE-family HTH domain